MPPQFGKENGACFGDEEAFFILGTRCNSPPEKTMPVDFDMNILEDTYRRPLSDLRISVTDRCNFRCLYCMPHEEYEWLEREEILSYEEIHRIAKVFVRLGVSMIRITGGEPLVRRDLEVLIRRLSAQPGLKDLSLTTNGALLAKKVPALKGAGLRRINVSLDTLDSAKFRRITQRGDLSQVLEGLEEAGRHGMFPIKINTVIERGVNDDEILDLVEFSRKKGIPIRFIEYMDVGNSNNWQSEKVVPKKEILQIIGSRFPLRPPQRVNGSAPSVDYEFADGGGEVGIIASVTEPFCSACTRARLTADGKLVTCLFSEDGYNLKALLRNGATDLEITEAVGRVWKVRADHYSEERFEALHSIQGYQAKNRQKMEMIRLGG